MTESTLIEELEHDPFKPFRLHLVSGKTLDILHSGTAHTLRDALLVLRNPVVGRPSAEGYDVVAYQNIERIERLDLGERQPAKRRKRA